MAYLLQSDFFCSTPWGVIYVLYIINTVIGKILIKIIPHYFCGYCSNVQHFTTLKNILSIGFWENPYKKDTAVCHACQPLFTVHLSFTHTVHLSFLKPYFCPLLYINYLLKVIYYNKVFFFFENSNPFIIFNKKNQCSITH